MTDTAARPLLPRDRVLILGALAALTLLSWAYLLRLNRQMADAVMMAEMGMPMDAPWTLVDAAFTAAMWLVMMVGMMAPSVAPVLMLFAAAQRSRGGGLASTICFGLGYICIWAAFSVLAAIVQWALHETALLTPAMAASSRVVAGAILVVAGLYQLTPAKGACLAHCRSPLGFLMSGWREGNGGAFRMGGHHGLVCLGCCWALMCVLFAVGVMNLVWVAALAALVLVEKAAPGGPLVARAVGVATMLFGVVVAFGRP